MPARDVRDVVLLLALAGCGARTALRERSGSDAGAFRDGFAEGGAAPTDAPEVDAPPACQGLVVEVPPFDLARERGQAWATPRAVARSGGFDVVMPHSGALEIQGRRVRVTRVGEAWTTTLGPLQVLGAPSFTWAEPASHGDVLAVCSARHDAPQLDLRTFTGEGYAVDGQWGPVDHAELCPGLVPLEAGWAALFRRNQAQMFLARLDEGGVVLGAPRQLSSDSAVGALLRRPSDLVVSWIQRADHRLWVRFDGASPVENVLTPRTLTDTLVRLANWAPDPGVVAVLYGQDGPRYVLTLVGPHSQREFPLPVAISGGGPIFPPDMVAWQDGVFVATPVCGDEDPTRGRIELSTANAAGLVAHEELSLPLVCPASGTMQLGAATDGVHVLIVWSEPDPDAPSNLAIRGAVIGCGG